MNIIENILAAIVVLGGLVTFHELGHFLAARWCGVHVIAFSFGFGRPLLSWKGKKGTRFMLSVLPLGGYVRLLEHPDELDDPAEQRGTVMSVQPCWKRAVIMAAGPVANFLLALLACWMLFLHGVTGIIPVIGDVAPQSWAAKGGLKPHQTILRVDGTDTPTWQHVQGIISTAGTARHVIVDTDDRQRYELPPLPIQQPEKGFWQQSGIIPWQPAIPAVIGSVQPESVADRAGLSAGMRIMAVNNVSVDDWEALLQAVRRTPVGQPVTLRVQWQEGDAPRNVMLQPEIMRGGAVPVIGIQPRVGAMPWPDNHLHRQRYPAREAFVLGAQRTWGMAIATVNGIRQLVTGAISPRNLGGPVMIARVAGESARSGLETFLGFLAYLSISLGIFNLLPIPMLDGGQLLYLLAEAVKGRPLSQRMQLWGRLAGMLLVSGLMIMALYFDLTRV